MIDLLTGAPLVIASSVLGWLGNAWLQRSKGRSEADLARLDNVMKLEQHRDGLTFELLTAARAELKELRIQVADLRSLEGAGYHLHQALEHIDVMLEHVALLRSPDDESRSEAERAAVAFLARIRQHDIDAPDVAP